MKRFILFAGDCYYPGGGAADFIGDFHNLIDAQIFPLNHNWSHILDTETGEVIELHAENDGLWTTKPIKEWQF